MFKQKYKSKLKLLALVSILGLISTVVFVPSTYAIVTCPDGTVQPGSIADQDTICANHQAPSGSNGERAEVKSDCTEGTTQDKCGIIRYLATFINVLSGLVGIIIVIMITIGGIQYSSARDNPQAAAAAKQRIFNAVIALVFFLFAFAFLQWLVPGGVFNG